MASPNLFYMFTEQTQEQRDQRMIEPPSEKKRPGRKPGRKKPTQPETKPPRQRGLGIVQLERLRIQERLNNLPMTRQPEPVPNPAATGTHALFPMTRLPVPVPNPVATHCGKGNYSGPMIGSGGLVVAFESGSEMVPAEAANGGGGFCGVFIPDPKLVDPGYNGVAIEPVVLFGSELTSIPKRSNNHYQAESSDAGLKKYHMQQDTDNNFQGNNINPHNFNNGEINGCYTPAQNRTNQSTYRPPRVMAIHNKGGSRTFEYDFVLGGSGKYPGGTSIEQEEASFVYPGYYRASDSTSIDLSLRL